MLIAQTSIPYTYSPGFENSIEYIHSTNPLFSFDNIENGLICITPCSDIYDDKAVYHIIPEWTANVNGNNYILDVFMILPLENYIYAWYIYDYENESYSSAHYFSLSENNISGNNALNNILYSIFSHNEDFIELVKSGYMPTGVILLNNKRINNPTFQQIIMKNHYKTRIIDED